MAAAWLLGRHFERMATVSAQVNRFEDRLAKLEQILPTLATNEELGAASAAASDALSEAVTKLATKEGLREAVAKLATKEVIDRAKFQRMKRSAFFVNIGRGMTTRLDDLVAALGAGEIAGAALDVYEQEPIVHPELPSLENVMLLPHLGSASRETRVADRSSAIARRAEAADQRQALVATMHPADVAAYERIRARTSDCL